jgi:hypothetical protein
MRSVVELNRGEHAQMDLSSITERVRKSWKTFFSSLLDYSDPDGGKDLGWQLGSAVNRARGSAIW